MTTLWRRTSCKASEIRCASVTTSVVDSPAPSTRGSQEGSQEGKSKLCECPEISTSFLMRPHKGAELPLTASSTAKHRQKVSTLLQGMYEMAAEMGLVQDGMMPDVRLHGEP